LRKDSWINAWELADIVKNLLKRSQMSLGSAQIASVIILPKSGQRLPGFMLGAGGPTAFPQNLPVMKEGSPVLCVSTGVRSLTAARAFVVYGMSGVES
jgi:hypothetical protein